MLPFGSCAVRSLVDKLRRDPPVARCDRSRASKAALRFESLEERLALYADTGYAWSDTDVSFSFVADGTIIDGYSSTLFEEMNANAETTVWQREMARALQTWANVSQLNFQLAPDGTGDIRFASQPLDGYLAYAYFPSGSSLGGDVFFNSDYTFRVGATYDIYAVTLHETGHSLGLDHSDVDGAVMEPYYQQWTGLTPDDIAGIQSIYGERQDDAFDTGTRNDSLVTATNITVDANGLVDFEADLTSMADIDFYRLVAPTDGDGTMSVTLAARSLLSTKVMVYDSAGNLLASDNAGAAYGTSSTLNLTGLTPGEEYFVVADGGTADEFGMGAYQLTVQFGGASGDPGGGDPGGGDPGGGDPGLTADRFEVNDSFAAATNLGRFNSRTETGLTLHTDSDADYFQFTARKGGTFHVTAASGSSVTVYDANHNVLAASSSGSATVSLAGGQTAYAVVQGLTGGYDLVIEKLGGGGGGKGGGNGGGKGGPKNKLEVAPAPYVSPVDVADTMANLQPGDPQDVNGTRPTTEGLTALFVVAGLAGSPVAPGDGLHLDDSADHHEEEEDASGSADGGRPAGGLGCRLRIAGLDPRPRPRRQLNPTCQTAVSGSGPFAPAGFTTEGRWSFRPWS